MADRIVTIDVRTQGLVEAERDARQANAQLDRLERRRNAGSSGSTSRAAEAALSTSGQSTGIGRGTAAGNSRGSGRDFARQAQGMGGLVQLYATFAANIFAVTTAFSMLSRSMDFKLMETGAKQLSVTLGVSLNSVARSIQATTDGAVSLKDALGSAALASSAGLSTQQIGKLAKAAKHASIVMGRDMTDSLNRMFRGVAKVEPELLDELGIMVKVNDANTKYAKSLGKTVSALTDFERRQAFANAAITKSEQLYSSLENGEQVVNSFSQATASLTNALITLGGQAGSALSPFLSALASSPTALYASIAALAGLLLRMAIPAFKDLGAAKLAALETEQATYTRQITALQKHIAVRKAEIDASNKSEVAAAQATIAKVANLFSRRSKANLALTNMLGMDSDQVQKTVNDFSKRLESEIKRSTTRLGKMNLGLAQLTSTGADKTSVFNLDKRVKFDDSADSINRLSQAIAALTSKIGELESAGKEVAGNSSRIAQVANAANTAVAGMELADAKLVKFQSDSEKLNLKIGRTKARAHGVELAEAGSPIAGFKVLQTELNKLSLPNLTRRMDLIIGSFNIATATIGGLVSKLTLWVGIFAVLTAMFKSFTDWMGWTNEGLDLVSEKFTTATESTKAFSTALIELGRSMDISEYVNRSVAAISLQAQALDSYLSGIQQYQATMNKTGSQGSFSRWWERNAPHMFSTASDSTDAFKELSKGFSTEQRTSLDAFAAKAGPKKSKLNAEEYHKFLMSIIQRAELGSAIHTKTTKDLEDFHNEMKKLGISSLKVAEDLKAIIAVEKVVSDSATDFISGLAFQSKEFTAANNILSGLAKTANVLSIAGTSSKDGLTGLTATLNNLSSNTTRVYASLSDSTISSLDQIQARIDVITNSKDSEANKKKKLQDVFSDQNTIATVIKANLEAANNLVALALTDSREKIASADINKSLKRMSAVATITGTSDSYVIKTQEQAFQDKLIRIQLDSLIVQRQMLAQTNKLNTSKLMADTVIASRAGVTQQVLDSLFGKGVITASNIEQGGTETIPPGSITDAQVSAAYKLMEGVLNAKASAATSKVALATIRANIATLSANLSTTLVKNLEDLKNKFNESGKKAELERNKKRASVAEGVAWREIIAKGLDTESLSNSIYKLVEGNEELKTALHEQASLTREMDFESKALKFVEDELKTPKLTDTAKKELTSEKEAITKKIEELKASKELADTTVKIAQLKQGFDLLYTKLTFATGTLSTFAQGLTSSTSLLKELTTVLVARPESLGDASNLMELSKKVASTQFKYEELTYSQAKRKLQLAKEAAAAIPLENLPGGEEQRAAELASLDAKLFNLALAHRTRELEYLKEELDHEVKAREIRMKQAENIGGYFKATKGGFWSSQNWKDASGIFFTSLDEITGNITSSLSQFARGMADVLDKSIDLLMDSWRKGELTKKNIIPKLRNLASDMFAQMASNTMKQAVYGGMKDLGKWITGNPNFGKSDQDIERERVQALAAKIAQDTSDALVIMNPLLGKLDSTLEELLNYLKSGGNSTKAPDSQAEATTYKKAIEVDFERTKAKFEEKAQAKLADKAKIAAAMERDQARTAAEVKAKAAALALTEKNNSEYDQLAKAIESTAQADFSTHLGTVYAEDEAAVKAARIADETKFEQERQANYRSMEEESKAWFMQQIKLQNEAPRTFALAKQPEIVGKELLDTSWDAWAKGSVAIEKIPAALERIGARLVSRDAADFKELKGLVSFKDKDKNTQYYQLPTEMIGPGKHGFWPLGAEDDPNNNHMMYQLLQDKAGAATFDEIWNRDNNNNIEDTKKKKKNNKKSSFEDGYFFADNFALEEAQPLAPHNAMYAARKSATMTDAMADISDKDILKATQASARLAQEAAEKAEAISIKIIDVTEKLGKKYDELMKVMKVISDPYLKRSGAKLALNDGVAIPPEAFAKTIYPEIGTSGEDALALSNRALLASKNVNSVLEQTANNLESHLVYITEVVARYELDGGPNHPMPIPNEDGQLLWEDQQRKETPWGSKLHEASLAPKILEADKQELSTSYALTEGLKSLTLAASNATTVLGNLVGSTPGMTTGTSTTTTTTTPTAPKFTSTAAIDPLLDLRKGFASMGSSGLTSLVPTPAFASSSITGSTLWGAGMAGAGSWLYDLFMGKAALGGVAGPGGFMPLHKFAKGGIATKPQLALFGEGSGNEAFVPLPDNRTIPVTLSGANSGGVTMGDTSISISVNVQKDGNTDVKTDAKMATEMGKAMTASVKQTVQEELIKQRRPGGLLYR